MLKPFGLSVVASEVTLARATIVESPIHMVTLLVLVVQKSISSYQHSRKSTEGLLRHVALKGA